MKKIISYFLLSIFWFHFFPFEQVYANTSSLLGEKKDTSMEFLENAGAIVSSTIERLEKSNLNPEIDSQLSEKKQEAAEYILEAKEKIQHEDSIKDINQIISEAKKTLVLKVVSGITPYENIEENIDSTFKKNQKDILLAKEAIQDSLQEGEYYSLQIKTSLDQAEVIKRLHSFDPNIQIDPLYNQGDLHYFELKIFHNSLLSKEILGEIQSGIIPEQLIGIDIVPPEVLRVEEIEGEDIERTRGVQSYHPEIYLEAIKNSQKKIQIGIIDTGINYHHPDLRGKVLPGYDFVNNDTDANDDQGHGTHVSGTIAAKINNSGIIGVNPYVELVPLKICNSQGFCPIYAVTKALAYSKENKIDIVNMSLGGKAETQNNPVCDGIESYVSSGGLAIVAAGNSNIDASLFVPGGCDAALTVGAYNEDNTKASFSNYGAHVDVSAPGVGIYSTSLNNSYKKLNGTSMATPHITGIVSILKTFRPEIKISEVKKLLKKYPLSISGDRPIASGVDMDRLMEELTKPFSIKEADILFSSGTFSLQDDAEIVKNLHIIPNQIFQETPITGDLSGEKINLGNLSGPHFLVPFGDSSLSINDEKEYQIEERKLLEEVVGNIDTVKDFSDQIYNADGKKVSKILKINTNQDEPTFGEKIGTGVDIHSLPLNPSNFLQQPDYSEYKESQEGIPKEIFLSGSENALLIHNFSGESRKKEVTFNSLFTGAVYSIDMERPPEVPELEPGVFYGGEISQGEEVVSGSIISVQTAFECNITKGQSCAFRITHPSQYTLAYSQGGIVSTSTSSKYLTLQGISNGTTTLSMYLGETLYHTISIQVKPIEMQLYETKSIFFNGKYVSFRNYDSNLLQYYGVPSGRSHIPITQHSLEALHPGKTFLQVYTQNTLTSEYNIEILPKPIEREYSLTFNNGEDMMVHFPTDTTNLVFSSQGDDIFEQLQTDGSTLLIRTNQAGKNTLTMKDSNGFLLYTVHIESTPYIDSFSLFSTDKVETWCNTNYDFKVENSSIASFSFGKKGCFITAGSPGKTFIKIYDKNKKYRRLFEITVTPIPTPVEINCEVIQGKKCEFSIRNNGFYYFESSEGVVKVDSSRSGIEVLTQKIGTAKIYVKSEFGTYITHILTITSQPTPPQIYTCETLVGGKCETYYYGSDKGYTYKVNIAGIVGLYSKRYSYLGTPTSTENLHIEGISQGKVEIYVYQNTHHVATIVATILPKISLEFSLAEITIGQTQEKHLETLTGYGRYKEYYRDGDINKPSWDKNIIEFGVDTTGNVQIRGLHPGITYPAVVDTYGNTGRIKVTVEDITLQLDSYESYINPQEEVYVKVIQSYGAVNKIRKNNNNVFVYKHTFPDGTSGVKIIAKYSGTSVVSLIDSEANETAGQIGNEKTILIHIGGSERNPDYEEYAYYDNGIDNCVIDTSGDLHDGKCQASAQEETVLSDLESTSLEIYNSLLDGYNQYLVNIGYPDKQLAYAKKETGMDIAHSPSYAPLCELGKATGIYYVRPYFGECVQGYDRGATTNAWHCNQGYTDLYEKGFNACIKDEVYNNTDSYYINFEKLRAMIDAQLKIATLNARTITSEQVQYIKTKLLKIKRDEYTYQATIVYYDELLNELYQRNPYKNGRKNDIQQITQEFEVKTKAEITQLKQKVVSYELQILQNEAKLQDLKNELGVSESGMKGVNDAINDYISGYMEFLDLQELQALIRAMANLSVKDIEKSLSQLYEIYQNIDDILRGLKPETKQYYKSYVTTSLALETIPVKMNKIHSVKKENQSQTYNELIELLKAYKVKKVAQKVQSKISHIVQVEIKPDGTFNGVHSYQAITSHLYGARIEIDEINAIRKQSDQPYSAKVYANDENGNELLKSGRSGYSTFFPDSWDQQKIIEEVQHAIENNKGRVDPKNSNSNLYSGYSTDGKIEIHFALDNNELKTFYPIIIK